MGPTPTALPKIAGPSDATTPRLRPERVYSLSDLQAAGWKKSSQLSRESLPLAEDAWYGFFDRKDIEVRVYASHADASGPGEESAAQAVVRSQSTNVGGGALISGDNRVKYHAYVVVGNLVLLCEQTANDCLKLVDRLR